MLSVRQTSCWHLSTYRYSLWPLAIIVFNPYESQSYWLLEAQASQSLASLRPVYNWRSLCSQVLLQMYLHCSLWLSPGHYCHWSTVALLHLSSTAAWIVGGLGRQPVAELAWTCVWWGSSLTFCISRSLLFKTARPLLALATLVFLVAGKASESRWPQIWPVSSRPLSCSPPLTISWSGMASVRAITVLQWVSTWLW